MKKLFRTSLVAAAVCMLISAAPANAETSYRQTQTTTYQSTRLGILSSSDIAHVQQRLEMQGFYTGAIDGKQGPLTRQATRAFQASQNLPANGRLTSATLEALDLDLASGSGYTSDFPAAGPAYEETSVATMDVYTTRSGRGFSSAEYDAGHSTCLTCADGIFGNGGKPGVVD